MSDLLETSGVSTKKQGDALTHDDINAINNTTNRAVGEINKRMKAICNINIEELKKDNYTTRLSLSEAIALVQPKRKIPGLIIRFLDKDGVWVNYEYKRTNTSDTFWKDETNWGIFGSDGIDGGTF